MKKTKLRMLAVVLFTIATVSTINAQTANGVNTPTNCVPPTDGEYAAQFHSTYTPPFHAPVDLTNPSHDLFTTCHTLPPAGSGATTVHTFGSRVRANVTSGGVAMQVSAPAQVTVRVTDAGPSGAGGEMYQTEMLQLDIQGGTLPVGMMIRESPTLQSTGQTKSTQTGTGYHIDSFFDIFTELSVDGGNTWSPGSQPGHMALQPAGTGIPTIGEWGLIIFSSLMIAFAVTMLYRKSPQLT